MPRLCFLEFSGVVCIGVGARGLCQFAKACDSDPMTIRLAFKFRAEGAKEAWSRERWSKVQINSRPRLPTVPRTYLAVLVIALLRLDKRRAVHTSIENRNIELLDGRIELLSKGFDGALICHIDLFDGNICSLELALAVSPSETDLTPMVTLPHVCSWSSRI